MKVALEVKNLSKLIKPTNNDVIVFDGKEWYVTTKDDILSEANGLLAECRAELEALRAENEEFKRQTSHDIIELTETVRNLLELKGDNL